jgi:hypothetical protein
MTDVQIILLFQGLTLYIVVSLGLWGTCGANSLLWPFVAFATLLDLTEEELKKSEPETKK